jgi:hypothetical protein
LAAGIGVDPSFLSKVLNGKKPWPAGQLARATEWATAYAPNAEPRPLLPLDEFQAGNATMLEMALAYRDLGWSVVPQQTKTKQTLVKWKPFQERLPTKQEIQEWFHRWRKAGLAVVLGPISDLFVVDVDGPEAHAALIAHLGAVPLAPKVLSGSGKPDRYHLFFRDPGVPTKAKQTPWHPTLEFRGNRGIVVLPPSLHQSGNRYRWAPGLSPNDLALPAVPPLILKTLRDLATPKTPPQQTLRQPTSDDGNSLPGSRSTRAFLRGDYADGPNWNSRLFEAACDLKGCGMNPEEAEDLLLRGARPWNEQEKAVASATIQSAFSQERVPGRY